MFHNFFDIKIEINTFEVSITVSKSPAELKSLFLKLFCYITWFE